MNKIIFKSIIKFAAIVAIPLCSLLSSCKDDIDTSNLYTFTGETVEDFLTNRSEQFSDFNYIMQRSGLDRIMSAYGSYTCFAPTNAAVEKYIDSLYNDKENELLPHNGMTEHSLKGLTDSLCKDIAKFHLCNDIFESVDMSGNGITIPTMLGRSIITSIDTLGETVLNDKAAIISVNNKVVNGVVHVINNVIPRSNRLMASELSKHTNYSLFEEALERTGLADSLLQTEVKRTYVAPPAATGYYTPKTCKVGYTLFAETNDVLNAEGIKSFDDLVSYANEMYGKSADQSQTTTSGWYDYYRDNHITVSTSTDYTSRSNALNMFVAYHILKFSLPKDKITIDFNVWNGNGYNGDTYEYYETMLPKTIMKVWKVKNEGKYYINRYQKNNTLTDGVETMGSASMHELVQEGIHIMTDSVIQPLNGYIYPIDKMLVYDRIVPKGVLNERMRMDALSFIPEIMNMDFRGSNTTILTGINGGVSAGRIRYPYNYFDGVISYNGNNTTLDQNVPAASGNTYLLYLGDSFQGMGQYDLAFKLPPVPDGLYELRVNADLMPHGSMLQFYLGEGKDRSAMEAIDIPFDMRMEPSDPRVGWTDASTEDDKGLATDKAMKNRGFLRAPLSITKNGQTFISRFQNYQVRKILIKKNFKQGEYWLRMKTVLPDVSNGKFQLDYIEFVPVNISENEQYLEDMY